MTLQSPTNSPYPGKYVMIAFATFFALMTWGSARAAMHARRQERERTELGFTVKPDPKKSVGNNVAVACFAFFLLVSALIAIYVKWPE